MPKFSKKPVMIKNEALAKVLGVRVDVLGSPYSVVSVFD